MPNSFYIDKNSDTAADALLAIGFAKFLQVVQRKVGQGEGIITIQDAGSCYIVKSEAAITLDDLRYLAKITLIQPVTITPKDKEGEEKVVVPVAANAYDYQSHMNNSKRYYAAIKEYKGTPNIQEKLEENGITSPDKMLNLYAGIVQMRVASNFNELVQRWDALGDLQREFVGVLLALFATPDNDVESASARCQKLLKEAGIKQSVTSTALQVVNATAGKGANRAKANGVSNGESIDSFWPLELLKFIGFMVIAAPYVVQGSKDRKTYVLLPKNIKLSQLEGMMRDFRAVCWSSTAVKLDVMAALRFTEVFIEHHRVYLRDMQLQQEDEDEPLDEQQVTSVAHGFEVAFYKDMGSAHATMNIATLNFPQWLRIETHEDAERMRDLLREHRSILQNIRTPKNEEGSEEFELLRAYRDFLSGNDLTPLWRFTTAYSGYLISKREHEKNAKRWLRQLSTTGLEQIIAMTTNIQPKPLSQITSNAGFQRIAYAIRQATVRAQYQRSQEREREVRYDVRYGLGQDLMREVRYREKFIAALSSFLAQYNAETAREEEKLAVRLGGRITSETRRTYKLRGSVAYSDIDEIVKLIDEFDTETVGSLLVAYGYASEPYINRESVSPEDDTNATQPGDDQTDSSDDPEGGE
jgi:hypothetical protein